MVDIRGLSLHDTCLFKDMVKKKSQKLEQKIFKFKKYLVFGKNFFKRRAGLIKVLNKIFNINKDLRTKFKEVAFFSKLYSNVGLYTVSSRFFLFFKVLKKKNNNYFFIKKLRSFFYETLKTNHKQSPIVIIERIDLMDKGFVKILKNFVKINKTKILLVFTGNNLKKNKIIQKIFSSKILRGNHWQNQNNLNYRKPLSYTPNKNYFTSRKKFQTITGNVFLFFKNISFDFLRGLKIRSEYFVFLNFIFFKLFSFTKKFNSELLNKFFQFSAYLGYEKFFPNKFIYFELTKNLEKDFKKKLKNTYIDIILIILINSMK